MKVSIVDQNSEESNVFYRVLFTDDCYDVTTSLQTTLDHAKAIMKSNYGAIAILKFEE